MSNLLAIESALTGEPIVSLERGYAGQGYGQLKTQVAERVVAVVEPFQRRMAELLAEPEQLDDVLGRRRTSRCRGDSDDRAGLRPGRSLAPLAGRG